MTEQWPTEAMATAALDAAAKKVYEINNPNALATWDEAPIEVKNVVRQALLSVVWAALAALPDPRRGAWFAGKHAAVNAHPSWWNTLENPYPESKV